MSYRKFDGIKGDILHASCKNARGSLWRGLIYMKEEIIDESILNEIEGKKINECSQTWMVLIL